MSKRKSNKPHKADAETTGVAKPAPAPKRAVSAPALMTMQDEALQAAPDTETKLPELPGQVFSTLPPAPPAELEPLPTFPQHLAGRTLDIVLPVEARPEAKESIHAAIGDAGTASPPAQMDEPVTEALVKPLVRPSGALAGVEAYQTLFMEMTRDNLDFAASFAAMRSPLDMLDVATKFAGRQIGLYGRFSKAVADIAAGRQAPGT